MEHETQFGIQYNKISLDEESYLLYPVRMIEGYCMNNDFCSDKIYPIINDRESLEKDSFFVDNIFSLSHLQKIYQVDDKEFLMQFFWNKERYNIFYVLVENGKIIKRKLNLDCLRFAEEKQTYELKDGTPTVTLNRESLSQLLSEPDIDRLRCRLVALSDNLKKLSSHEKTGLVRIDIEGNQLKNLYLKNNVISTSTKASDVLQEKNVSLQGLEKYMKEHVFGHDDEVSRLATVLYMNYTALPDEKTESVLLVGPTGTGKTQTIRAAMEYLNLPMVELKGSTFVPPGIKGTSLEDGLSSLLAQCNNDISLASRGIVYIDEFDKIGEQFPEYVSAIMNSIMTFIEGDPFYFSRMPLNRSDDKQMFQTNSLNRIFSGTFSRLFENSKAIGFGSVANSAHFDLTRLTSETAFTKELISRFPHLVVYNVLDHKTKLDILQHANSSVFTKKKARYQRQFQVEMTPDISYFDALLDQLKDSDNSMRDLNNLVTESLTEAEHAMALEPSGTYKVLKLTKDTVDDPKKFYLS